MLKNLIIKIEIPQRSANVFLPNVFQATANQSRYSISHDFQAFFPVQIARVYTGEDLIYFAPTKVQITSLKSDRELSQTISEHVDVTPMTQFPCTSLNVTRDLHALSRFKNLSCCRKMCFLCLPLNISSFRRINIQALSRKIRKNQPHVCDKIIFFLQVSDVYIYIKNF